MADGLLNEIALAGPEHLELAYVAGYDQKAGVDPTEDLEALRARGLGPDSTLIDFGAGTGTFALAAASVCDRVVAVDVSPAMLAAVSAKVAAHGVRNIELVQAGFLSYEHQGSAPDFIHTRNALHHLPDFWKAVALERMAALLAPGGILQLRDLVFSFEIAEIEAGIAAWLQSAAETRAEKGWTRDELETHLREEYSTFTWLLEPMIDRAGFEIATADYAAVGAYASYICVRRGRVSTPRSPVSSRSRG
jgi:ubiquinone/menaquinone biosynthesis C-methylase UbiE